MVSELVAIVSLVIQLNGAKEIGSASGFFYTSGDKLYFVTNKHVVRDPEKGIFPDRLRLKLHRSAENVENNGFFDVELFKEKKPLWLEHKKDAKIDVAVIPLERDKITKNFFVKALSKSSFLPADYLIFPGDDVFIVGFPLGLHDFKHNLPIFRNALVASAYGIPFNGAPMFLTDANLHPGTSGSPVFTKPKSTWVDKKGNTNFVTGTNYYFVGVHSATLGVKSSTGAETPLGLGSAWYSYLVQEIIDQ